MGRGNPREAPLARLDLDRDAVRVQIPATEHWGLLSARSNNQPLFPTEP
jgi:hypothetical protein